MRIVFLAKESVAWFACKNCDFKKNVLLVICQHSDPSLHSFEEFAKESNIEIFSPADPNEASAINKLESMDVDLFILAGYGMILGKRCLSIPNALHQLARR